MKQAITQTKIIRPRRRADLISRPRLLKLIEEQLERKLLLVIAPAGYGKTSLLIDLAHNAEAPFCWYSVGELEQDFHRFVAYFVAAIERQHPTFGAESQAALQNLMAGNSQVEQLIATIVNEIYEQVVGQLFIVIDDYHLVNGCAEIDAFVSAFIAQSGDNCHLILASRSLVNLPNLPLFVARLQVWGLGLEELAFQTDEIQGLLKQNLDLTINDRAALEMIDATEGWITGLLLSTQTMQKDWVKQARLMRVSGMGLYEYLAQEVFEQQRPVMQEFLLRTSLLEEFNTDLCAAVFEPLWYAAGTEWQPYFEALLENNLFVLPVGEGDSSWLRYHHLFREFLQRKLMTNDPQDFQAILERVADVFFERKEWERAYQLYRRAGSQNAIIDLVEAAGASLLTADRSRLLGQWLDMFDSEAVADHRPVLCSLKGCIAVLRGDPTAGIELLSRAIEAFEGGNHHFQWAIALYRRAIAYRFAGDYAATINDADEALRLLTLAEENSLHDHDHEIIEAQADALQAKGTGLCMSGQLSQGLEWLELSLRKNESLGNDSDVAKVLLDIATTHLNLGQYTEARSGFEKALKLLIRLNNVSDQATVLNNLGVLYHAQGQYIEAFNALRSALECAQRSHSVRLIAFVRVSLGDLFVDLEMHKEAARTYAEAHKASNQAGEKFLLIYLTLVRAMLDCSIEDWSNAYSRLDEAGRFLLESRTDYEWGLYRMGMGRFYLAQQGMQKAIVSLEDAITSFENGQYGSEKAAAHLLVAIAYHQNDELMRGMEHLTELTSIASKFENQQSLIAVARHFESTIRNISETIASSANLEIHSYLCSLLEQIVALKQQLPTIQNNINALMAEGLRNRSNTIQKAVASSTAALQIRTLGRIEVRKNGKLISGGEWKSQTARDLFLCLLDHSEGLTKEEVGTHFWPDSAPAQLKIRFKNAIYRLRNAVGPKTIIFKKNVYQFDRSIDYEWDAEQFVAQVMLAYDAECIESEQEAYETALSLYTGDYLPDLDAIWAWLERERLRTIFLDASTRLAEIYLERDLYSDALECCQNILTIDPCLEEAHRLIMRAYAATGNRAAVVRQYEQCCNILQEEIDAPPSDQTEDLFKRLMQ